MTRQVPDRVLIDEGPGQRMLAIAEFMRLSLTERVRYLLADRVKFFRGAEALPTGAALHALVATSVCAKALTSAE